MYNRPPVFMKLYQLSMHTSTKQSLCMSELMFNDFNIAEENTKASSVSFICHVYPRNSHNFAYKINYKNSLETRQHSDRKNKL